MRAGVPKELERIVGKCLAKDTAERYAHAEDLLVDLRALFCQLQGLSDYLQLLELVLEF